MEYEDLSSVRSTEWITRRVTPSVPVKFAGEEQPCPVSIVILAKDEERCIARCLDSVVDLGLDNILVLDTGSTDDTPRIVERYRDHGVRLIRTPWTRSFARTRNQAIDAVGEGWIVFLDADEWLTERSARNLRPCLMYLSRLEGLRRMAFAPEIIDVDRNVHTTDLPRIFRADSAIRYRGEVHEYPVIAEGPGTPVDVIGIDIQVNHDGYTRSVVISKDKRRRNLDLLETARANDPGNPRWWYFSIRDGHVTLDHAELISMCDTLKELTDKPARHGDHRGARDYYRRALAPACQRLAAMRDWTNVSRYCEDLPRVDAYYFRAIRELLSGAVTESDLLEAVRLRRDDEMTADSVVEPSARHLDAIIIALLERVRDRAEADRYLEFCSLWTDSFFEDSRLREPYRQGRVQPSLRRG
ncbi:glycosyltransferase [Nonomuraea sp. SBT364]|uniref:glycosyltransferase n=1 Tax=Nonomuraea sp. SBT364 TaxID=1580530 RepID=UPI0018CEFD5A|nr:glycosyltransferase [Nonomuraea sp. SBT364]